MSVVEKTSWVTPDKQDGFSKYLALHIEIVRHVFDRARPSGWTPAFRRYVYIDTHCGSGDAGPYGPGSPLLFLETIDRAGLDFEAHFVDCVPANIAALRARVAERSNVHIHEADNIEAVPAIVASIPADAYGLLYMDPFGVPNIDLLEYVSARLPKVDLLVRVPTRAIKRVRNAHHRDSYLVDIITRSKKERWLIRGTLPGDNFDWTFLFGTNYTEWNEWRKERFYRTDSPDGRRILTALNYTEAEQNALTQPTLLMMAEVRERSGGICEHCGSRPATEPHHLRYGPGHDPAKVIHLCHQCHCLAEGMSA